MNVTFHMAGQWKSNLADGYMSGISQRPQLHRNRSERMVKKEQHVS